MLSKIIFTTTITTSLLFGLDLNSIIKGNSPLFDYDFNIPGVVNGNVTCFEDGLNIPSLESLCNGYLNDFSSKTDKVDDKISEVSNNYLRFGPCSFNSDKGVERSGSYLSKLCKKYANTDPKKIELNSTDSIIIDDDNLSLFGGDAYYKKDNSNPLGTKIGGKTVEDLYKNELSYKNVSKTIPNALFSGTNYSIYKDCIKKATFQGKDPALCKEPSNLQLPNSKAELENSMIEAIRKISEDPLNKNYEKSFQIRTRLQSINKKCDGESNKAKCEEDNFNSLKVNYGSDNITMSEYRNKQMKIIEENAKSYLDYLDKANIQDLRINFPTQDALNHINIGKRRNYISMANKQIANRILLKSTILTLTNLKKELIDINFYDLKNNSKPFYYNDALKKAKQIMKEGL